MSDIIVSCAGCGKRYKGTPGTQKYKCAGCANLFTYPQTAQAPAPGTVLCSLCWAEVEITDGLTGCPVCSQKISVPQGGARAVVAMVSGVSPALTTPDMQSVVRERDELRAGKAKLERTMAELMERIAQVEEKSAVERRGETGPSPWELQMEIAELTTRLESLKKHEAGVLKDRDAAMLERNQAVAERDQAKLEAKMNSRQVEEMGGVPAVAAGSPDATATVVESPANAALQLELDAANAEIERLKADAGGNGELQQKLGDLEKDLNASKEAQEKAQRETQELALKLSELEQQLAEMNEACRKAERDRDEATRQLNTFRDTAVSTLEPFAHDYRKLIKTSVADAESLLAQALRAREEVTRQLQNLETIAAQLTQHLSKDGRELHSRLADLLGLPGDSGIRNATSAPVLGGGSETNGTAASVPKEDLTETKV